MAYSTYAKVPSYSETHAAAVTALSCEVSDPTTLELLQALREARLHHPLAFRTRI